MKHLTEASLRSLNMKWLVALAFFDALIAVLVIAPERFGSVAFAQMAISRGLLAIVLPVLVLLIVNSLPHDLKSMLVYWKPRGVLPGSEAFTKHGPGDNRIDMTSLKKHVGKLPTDPAEQNSRWYKLYKMVANESEVLEAHKLFLMYRDMAVMSLPLCVLVPAAAYGMGASTKATALAAVLLIAQYLLAAMSARWSGIRFVCNVLAIHSTKKVTVTSPAAAV
jgi:hypothetical protein